MIANSPLDKAIQKSFGSPEKMIEIFTTMEKEQNGSGWAWLVYAKATGTLEVKMTMNNDQIT